MAGSAKYICVALLVKNKRDPQKTDHQKGELILGKNKGAPESFLFFHVMVFKKRPRGTHGQLAQRVVKRELLEMKKQVANHPLVAPLTTISFPPEAKVRIGGFEVVPGGCQCIPVEPGDQIQIQVEAIRNTGLFPDPLLIV